MFRRVVMNGFGGRLTQLAGGAAFSRALYRGSFEQAGLYYEGCWDKPPRA